MLSVLKSGFCIGVGSAGCFGVGTHVMEIWIFSFENFVYVGMCAFRYEEPGYVGEMHL